VTWWRELKRRFWFVGNRSGFDEELDQEIRFHLDSRAGKNSSMREFRLPTQERRHSASLDGRCECTRKAAPLGSFSG
jgi:hypothetical protein